MKIHVHTDASLTADAAQTARLGALLELLLDRFSGHLSRVDAQLSEPEAGAGGPRCRLEARVEGREPVAVTHQAAQLVQAVRGAADQLARLLDSTLERLHGYPRGAGLGALKRPLPETGSD